MKRTYNVECEFNKVSFCSAKYQIGNDIYKTECKDDIDKRSFYHKKKEEDSFVFHVSSYVRYWQFAKFSHDS